jgi:PIN domain nuclease of toxin-antitoxin system
MDLILDTHAFIWLLRDDERLSGKARDLLTTSSTVRYISAVCAFEIATKVRIGKWPEAAEIDRDFASILEKFDFKQLPLSALHGRLAGSFQSPYRDPFDRLLAAQSIIERMPVVSLDASIRSLGAETVW